jgi:Mce-associated membrane protein
VSPARVAAAAARVPQRSVDAVARRGSRLSHRGRVSTLVVLGVVAAALLVGVIALGVVHQRNEEIGVARGEGQQAAESLTTQVLSYNAPTIDQDAARAKGLLAGGFQDEFGSLLDQVIVPRAREGAVRTHATVTGSAVVSAQPGALTALLFVNQETTSNQSPTPVVSGSRVRVTVVQEDGEWKVSELSPV